jgi:hypothetical protein
MNPNHSDPVIDEIRERRHQVSERFGHDPARLVAYYMELQMQYRDRLTEPTAALQTAEESEPTQQRAGELSRT